jgi:class 3 adenylate cyclase
MFKMAVGHTKEVEGLAAASDLLSQCASALAGNAPRAGIVLAGHDLDLKTFLAAVNDAHPGIQLIGCTTLAPLSSVSRYSEGATTLTLFASSVIDFTTGLGAGVAADVGLAARTAVAEAASKTAKPPALAVVTPSVEGFDPAGVSAEIGAALGAGVPTIGGGALPDFPVGSPWVGGLQVFGREIMTDSMPVLLLSGPLAVSVGVRHGWKPVGRESVVTRSKGEKVYEIDGEPVVDFYRHYLGTTGEPALGNPLAIFDPETGSHYLRAPVSWDPEEGSASFLGSVPEGSLVQLAMASTDEILAGTAASVADAVAGFPAGARPEGALISACAVRNILLGTKTELELETIKAGLGPDIPLAGFYAFGEIAPLSRDTAPRFHNETCVTVLFGTADDERAEVTSESRTLAKKLARAEAKLQSLETARDQNANLMRALMADLDAERAESERLLLNILPESIARRLKSEPGVIAERHESVSVMFVDIVGFTPLSEKLSAEEMVEWLNGVYSVFDALVGEHGVEKIRTIGDGYMVAGGVPQARADHATAITSVAVAMRNHFESLPPVGGRQPNLRIGIHSGPVVGGVIGTHKFQYDLWGDTVNTAARMESHGLPGRIQVTEATYLLIEDEFVCEPRGEIEIKGKNSMPTWFVINRR